jgi:hypothetical protein
MRRYKCAPRWITVRFDGTCALCKRAIHLGYRLSTTPGNVRHIAKPKSAAKRQAGNFRRDLTGRTTLDVGSEGRCIKEIVSAAGGGFARRRIG